MDCLREARPDCNDLVTPSANRDQRLVVSLLELAGTFK
jgi:hypothetical protein